MLALERHQELTLPEPTRTKLMKMSASTMDRLLRRHRHLKGRGVCATRPGGLLKSQVAVRLANGWDDSRPGYGEIDCVAHCGERFEGEFFHTVGFIDIATGWSEFRPLKAKGQKETLIALQGICKSLPFKVLGLDSDNGSEFLNWHLVNFCQGQDIQLTRGRPYHKNDQCRIEQKNGAIVRKHAGYRRYDTLRSTSFLGGLTKRKGVPTFMIAPRMSAGNLDDIRSSASFNLGPFSVSSILTTTLSVRASA